jgi:hypothetical protein
VGGGGKLRLNIDVSLPTQNLHYQLTILLHQPKRHLILQDMMVLSMDLDPKVVI